MPGSVLASGRYRVVADISGKNESKKWCQSAGQQQGGVETLEADAEAAGRAGGSALNYRPPDRAERYGSVSGLVRAQFQTIPWPGSYRAR